MFNRDPEIKREVIWRGEMWHDRRALIDRRNGVVCARDEGGAWRVLEQHLPIFDSMFSRLADPVRAPEVLMLREEIRSWRFYDHFRSDASAPARLSHVGTRTPVLANDGRDLAAAWRTIMEIGDAAALEHAVADAFPGATVDVVSTGGRFSLEFRQHGLLRPLSQAELSDGTLRYLLWIAALLTPRPPSLMVLNEPETKPAYLTKGRDDRAGFFSRARARERKHSHALWCSEHVRAREKKTSEGAASAICSREELRKTEIAY